MSHDFLPCLEFLLANGAVECRNPHLCVLVLYMHFSLMPVQNSNGSCPVGAPCSRVWFQREDWQLRRSKKGDLKSSPP
eukprot:12264283-Prorocentrum_lima.AAC.1